MPSDRVCPGADINYKQTYDSICHEAFLAEVQSQKKRR